MLGRYDKSVGEIGLSAATRKLLGKFGEEITPNFEEGAKKCLQQDPVLVIGTHPGRLHASAIVAAMPGRDDSKLIGNSTLENIGPHFAEHLFSMELIAKKQNKLKRAIRKTIGFPQTDIPKEVAKQKNTENLRSATNFINDGGRVLIFPDNVNARGQAGWLQGVGRIMQQLKPDARVVFASANPNIKPAHLLRGKKPVQTEVSFSSPMTVRELLGAVSLDDPTAVAAEAERKYANWIETRAQDPRKRIRTYLRGRPELSGERDSGKKLDLTNRDEFEERAVSALRASVQPFLETDIPTTAVEGKGTDFLIGRVVLDDQIPISLSIYKGGKYEGSEKVANGLFLKLERGQEWIGEFALRDYGNEFRLSHRKINTEYRSSGIANVAMKSIEEFVREYVKQRPGREAVIHASAAQLDVISWFLKNGFKETEDAFPNKHGVVRMHKLGKVLDSLERADGKYTVDRGDFLYVFPGDYKGHHMNPGGKEPDDVNIDASALVHFKKVVSMQDIGPVQKIRGIQQNSAEKLGEIL